jgi:Tat protein translocase TatB subunit
MLDFSWIEFLVILVVGILVIGPKELPAILYQIGKIVRRLQYMKFALSNQFDDFMQTAELQSSNASDNVDTDDINTGDYKKPEPIFEQEDEESPFAKDPFHAQDDQDYDPDMEEDEEYVEQELSFLRDLREEDKI